MHFRIFYIFFFTTFFQCTFSYGQEKVTIKGKVKQSNSELFLEFASVSLYDSKDSTIVDGTMTDAKGFFNLVVPMRRYYLVVELLGYDRQILSVKSDGDLGTIALAPSSLSLAEVNIVGEKSETGFMLDKRIFNVGKDLTNKGGTAIDILDNVPSVSVDVEGNVSLRGGGNVKVLIDGKPSGLVGVESTNGLKSLPANLIDRVEVITNPSAKYEAEGLTGIINIVLKKENKPGYNGTLDLSGGWPTNGALSSSINYRYKKLNYFLNYTLNYNNGPSSGYTYLELLAADTIQATLTNRSGYRKRFANNIRTGAEYAMAKNQTLTTSFNYRYSNSNNKSTINYFDDIFLQNQIHNKSLVQRNILLERQEIETELEPNIEASIDYVHKYDDNGRELKLILQANQSLEQELSSFTENTIENGVIVIDKGEFFQRANNKEQQKSALLQADFTLPLAEKEKAEFGLRSAYRNIGNKYLVEDFLGDVWSRLDNFSNNFRYNEFIHAAYAIYGKQSNKWSYQGGLRWEISDFSTQLTETNFENNRYYNNLFPSGHINYTFKGKNQVQVSYSRRIQRPRFWDLNPFFTYSDNRNIFSGNPKLNPEFTNALELSHIKYWDMSNIGTTLYYRKTTDIIQRITKFNSDGTNTNLPLNLASSDNIGLEFLWAYSPTKTIKLDGNLNLFRQIIKGEYEGLDLGIDTYSWFGRIGSKIAIFKNHDLQLRFNYRAPLSLPQGLQKSQYLVDFAYSFDFLKNNQASFTFSWRDIFNQRRRYVELISDEVYQIVDFRFRRSPLVATFSYRLNKSKERKKPSQENMGDESRDF
jgi:outer membrane receptor protein involved in Fe transport